MWRAHLWLGRKTVWVPVRLFGVCFEKIRSLAIFSWESLSRYHLSHSKACCCVEVGQLKTDNCFEIVCFSCAVAHELFQRLLALAKKKTRQALNLSSVFCCCHGKKAGRPLFCCFDISSCHDMSRPIFFGQKKGATLEGPGSLERWAEVGHRFQWQDLAHFRFPRERRQGST